MSIFAASISSTVPVSFHHPYTPEVLIINGDNTVIQDKTFIGPYTSIGDNCTIKKASIENSIIMDNSNIDTENTIVDSIIGENSVIMNANLLKPAGKRLLLGENSRIYI